MFFFMRVTIIFSEDKIVVGKILSSRAAADESIYLYKLVQNLTEKYYKSPNPTFFPNRNRILPPSLKLPASEQRGKCWAFVLMDEVMTVGDAFSSSVKPSLFPLAPDPLLTSNLPLISAFLAGAIAQFLKIFTTWYTFSALLIFCIASFVYISPRSEGARG